MSSYYQILLVSVYTVILLFDKACAQDQAQEAAALGTDESFICPILENTLVRWTDVTTNVIIYTLNQEGEAVRHQQASDDKYNRYSAELASPTKFYLNITSVGVSDGGVSFLCDEIFSGQKIVQYNFSVEAKVISLTVNCQSPCDITSGTIETVENTECQCTCNAIGGYPDSLTLEWNKGSPGSQTNEISTSGPSGTYDFSRTVSFTTVRSYSPLECKVRGYTVQSIIESSDIVEEVSFNILYAPNCTLELEEVDVANICTVELTCKCDGNPEPMAEGYKYFRDDSLIDGSSSTITETLELDSTVEIKFTCSGTNILREGEQSSVKGYTCESPPTTLLPTTTVSTTVTTSLTEITSPLSTTAEPPPPPPVILIIIIVLCVVILLVVIGGAVYYFVFRNQGSSKSNHNTDKDFEVPEGGMNNTVTASTAATTNSAAPVYGVVNKSTKKKSDNTDGNGVNAKLASSPPEPTEPAEYASVNKPKSQPQAAPRSSAPPEKVELQYADIDHGNRGPSNEVRQPTNEPTEYATVQSVMV